MSTEFDGNPATELMSSILQQELKLRRTTQREECLLEKIQELLARDTIPLPRETERLRELHRRLGVLKENYWTQRYNWLVLRHQLKWPTLRGLIECRSNPRWYLSETLRQHCAENGGCCGRECQCCEDRSAYANSDRKLGYGHCTLECGCCSEIRGFNFTSKQKKQLDDGCVRPGRHLNCPLCLQLVFASFWGFQYEELCLVRKWRWWLYTRIAVIGFIMVIFYYVN